jgi:uncharacterized protein YbgA (DUF1722 family)
VAWHYTETGRLVADAGKRDWDELTAEYGAMLMEGLGVMGTGGEHVNVLQHLMGFLKTHLSSEDKQELLVLSLPSPRSSRRDLDNSLDPITLARAQLHQPHANHSPLTRYAATFLELETVV